MMHKNKCKRLFCHPVFCDSHLPHSRYLTACSRFEGAVQASKGQAFFLVFCTALSFATLALVLQIQFPTIGNYWFLLTLLSPYA